MKITKESLRRMIAEEFEGVDREVSTQDQSKERIGTVMAGYSQGEVTVIIDTLTRMNKTIHDDKTLTDIELRGIVDMIKKNIIPAVNTLSDTVNRKYKEAYPESGE